MAENQKVFDVDTLLRDHLGQLGKFQIKILGLIGILTMFVSFFYSSFIFTTARLSSRCYIPGCDVGFTEFSPSWILNAIPGSSEGNLEPCLRYEYNNITLPTDNTTEKCPVSMFDHKNTISCLEDGGIIYSSSESIVYDFNLGCKEWLRSIVGTAKSVATLIATPVMGVLADRFGRKTMLMFNVISGCLLGIIRHWAPTYTYFILLEIIESLLVAECFSCVYVLAIEIVGPDYRDVAGACVNSLISIGNSLLSLIAWKVPYWRKLTLAIYCPQIIIISYFWLMPESLRWLLNKQKFGKAEKVIRNIAKTNNKVVPETILEQLKDSATETTEKEIAHDKYEDGLIQSIFKVKTLLLRCIVIPIWWITSNFVHQGLGINAVNLSGNKYLNFMIVASVDLPAIWSSTLFLKNMGRRTLLASCFFICAICQIAQIFIGTDNSTLSLVFYLFGKYTIAVAGTVMLVYTAELFPTKYRQTLFGYVSTIGRLGSIVAPLMPSLSATIWPNLPFALYAGFALLSSCLIFFTPETKGSKLPDTLEDIVESEKFV